VPDYQEILANALSNLGTFYSKTGRPKLARAVLTEAIAIVKQLAEDHPLVPSYRHYGAIYRGNLGKQLIREGRTHEAETTLRETIEIIDRLAAAYPEVLSYTESQIHIHNNLAALYRQTRRNAEAETAWKEVMGFHRGLASKAPGMLDGYRLNDTCSPLANLYRETDRSKEAEQVWKEAVDLMTQGRIAAPASLILLEWLAIFQGNLAQQYQDQGKKELAIEAFKESSANWEKLLEKRKLATADPEALRYFVTNTAQAHARAQESAQAVVVIREHVALGRKRLPAASSDLGNFLAQVGMELLELRAFSDAEPILRECLEIRMKLAPDAWTTFNAKSILGGALLGQKKYADAASLLLAGYQGLKRLESTSPPAAKMRCSQALTRLVQLYEATGKKEEAAKWRKELEARKAADKP
jgi:tetratricopeptide (TPR) repeat protein